MIGSTDSVIRPSYWLAPLLAGLLPIVAAHLAYAVNIQWGDAEPCITYWAGCVSISMAVRTGPGLSVFQLMIVPGAAAMALTWVTTSRWSLAQKLITPRTARGMLWLGILGAIFLVIYSLNLGRRTEFYELLRRYGVIIYFSFTALAQLLLAGKLWVARRSPCLRNSRDILFWFVTLVSLVWLFGISFTSKRLVISNPYMLDRLERSLEWSMALLMSVAFLLLGWLIRRTGKPAIH